LLHRLIGLYVVLRQTTPVNYEVQLQKSRKKSDFVHMVCSKPFAEHAVEPLGCTPSNPPSQTLPPLVGRDDTTPVQLPPPLPQSQPLDVDLEDSVEVRDSQT
jgi:hypothetical protein